MMPRHTLLIRAPRALLTTVRRPLQALLILAAAVASIALVPAAAGAASRAPDIVPDRYIAVYRDAGASAGAETAAREKRDGFAARFVYRRAIKGFAAKLAPGQVRKLRNDPEIAFVTPDRRVHATRTALNTGDGVPTGVRRIGAATATTAHSASGAGVAVIDTGIDLDHPDLDAAAGTDCTGTGAPDDDNGHGTHVAGTIAARNDGAGVVGVAPGTRVWAVKVLGADGSGTIAGIICGIDWVTSTRTDADPDNDIAVANMSLGGPGTRVAPCATTTDPMHRAVCESTAAGVTYVVAAGNDGWDFDYASVPDTPAAYPEVLTVTAATDFDGRSNGVGAATCDRFEVDDAYASFSNFAATAAGAAHTIAAPGTCITSTWPGGGYGTISGTSMATPHVAGAVALCLDEGGVAGPCADDGGPAGVIATMRTDAQRATLRALGSGFYGDPLRPVNGRSYGYLVVGNRPGATPAPTTQVASLSPAAVRLVSGNVTAGSGSSLSADDGARLEIAAKSGTTYIAETESVFVLSTAQRASLKRLAIDHDGHATSGYASVALRAFNYRTGSWVTIDGPRTGVTWDRPRTWSAGVPADYVSAAGEVRFRVRATRSGAGFRTRTDVARVTIEF